MAWRGAVVGSADGQRAGVGVGAEGVDRPVELAFVDSEQLVELRERGDLFGADDPVCGGEVDEEQADGTALRHRERVDLGLDAGKAWFADGQPGEVGVEPGPLGSVEFERCFKVPCEVEPLAVVDAAVG